MLIRFWFVWFTTENRNLLIELDKTNISGEIKLNFYIRDKYNKIAT